MSSIVSNFSFNFGNLNDFYYKLLIEEDFDFKTKKIVINITNDKSLNVKVECNNVLDLKIATNALIKSVETIEKSINV
jgi:hypothetical protein